MDKKVKNIFKLLGGILAVIVLGGDNSLCCAYHNRI